MGFVEKIFTSVTVVLDGVAEQQFGMVAAQLGSTGQILATIAVIMMLINLSLQAVPVSQEVIIMTCVKMVLIALFLQNWSQFNSVANAVFVLFDEVSAALVNSVVSGTGDVLSGPRSFAAAFDDILARVADFANVTAGRLNILGSVINGIVWFLMALFSAVVALLMVGSRIVITLLIGLAPLAILSTMFNWSKNYFERWLGAVIAFALYPVVIAAVFATVLGLMGAIIDLIGDPEQVTSIGQVTPVLGVLCLSTLLAGMVPMIVSAISGNIGLQDMVTVGISRTSTRLARTVGGTTYGQSKQSGETKVTVTAGSIRKPIENTTMQVDQRAAQLNRMAARTKRFSER